METFQLFLKKDSLSKEQAIVLEKALIFLLGTSYPLPGIKRGPLTNMTSGGDGGDTFSNRKHSLEARKKISIGNSNKVVSEGGKKNISIGRKNRNIVNSEEHKKKMIFGLKNMSQKARANISKPSKGKIWIYNTVFRKNMRIEEEFLGDYELKEWSRGFRYLRYME